MTKEEQNQIIKDVWVRNLQKEKSIPEDVGEIYKNWLLGKIQEAHAQLNQPAQLSQPEDDKEQNKEAS